MTSADATRKVAVADPGALGPLDVEFGLLSSVGGSNLPFAFGHVFRQGDVPAGQFVDADLTDWQCVPTTYWPDGSLRHAIIAGRATCTQNVTKTITLSTAASDRSGTALTESDLSSALPTVTLVAGGDSFTLNSLVGTGALHRTVCAGPVMSNWLYRRAISGSDHLVAWFDVRLYLGGVVEIWPWIENAYFLVSGPTNDSRAYSLTIGESEVFSATINLRHHTRIPLITGSHDGYWTANPGITPQHDGAYVESTGMTPTYRNRSPRSTWLNGLQQTYTPNTLAGADSAMGSAGNQGGILKEFQAAVLTTDGDARAWKAMVVFGMSSGSWSIHWRDHTTNELFRWSDYPNVSLNNQDSPAVPTGSGGELGTPAHTHLNSYGYLPWLLTGRWFYLEECVAWLDHIYLAGSVGQRESGTGSGANNVMDPVRGNMANRGAHWAFARLVQAAAILPESYAKRADVLNAVEKNAAFYLGKYVDGTISSGAFVSPRGFLGDFAEDGYSLYHSRIVDRDGTPGDHWWGAGWMSAFACLAWGHAADLDLPISSQAKEDLIAVRNHAYKQVIDRAGDGTDWNWRRFVVYEDAVGEDETDFPPEEWHTAAEAYAALLAADSLTDPDPTPGGALMERYSDSAMQANTNALQYAGQQVSALAFAAQHGVTGAAAAWGRISGASNFAAIFEQEKMHDENLDLAIGPRA